jgi:hypothetical protein
MSNLAGGVDIRVENGRVVGKKPLPQTSTTATSPACSGKRRWTVRGYGFPYDDLNRLTQAMYGEQISRGGNWKQHLHSSNPTTSSGGLQAFEESSISGSKTPQLFGSRRMSKSYMASGQHAQQTGCGSILM